MTTLMVEDDDDDEIDSISLDTVIPCAQPVKEGETESPSTSPSRHPTTSTKEALMDIGMSLFAEATQWFKTKAPQTTSKIQNTLHDWHTTAKSEENREPFQSLSFDEMYEAIGHQSLHQLRQIGVDLAKTFHTEVVKDKKQSPDVCGNGKRRKRDY